MINILLIQVQANFWSLWLVLRPIIQSAPLISIAEIRDIRSGDEASFTEVFNLYYPKVYHHFLKRTHSSATAREAAQLTFIKLWEFRHTLSEAVSLDTQIFHIATGALIDYLRRENTQRKKVREAAVLLEDEAGAEHDRSFESSDYLVSLTRSLSPARKKLYLLLFVAVFALLLALSLGYNKISIKTGYVPQHIGQNTDTLTKKQRR